MASPRQRSEQSRDGDLQIRSRRSVEAPVGSRSPTELLRVANGRRRRIDGSLLRQLTSGDARCLRRLRRRRRGTVRPGAPGTAVGFRNRGNQEDGGDSAFEFRLPRRAARRPAQSDGDAPRGSSAFPSRRRRTSLAPRTGRRRMRSSSPKARLDVRASRSIHRRAGAPSAAIVCRGASSRSVPLSTCARSARRTRATSRWRSPPIAGLAVRR